MIGITQTVVKAHSFEVWANRQKFTHTPLVATINTMTVFIVSLIVYRTTISPGLEMSMNLE